MATVSTLPGVHRAQSTRLRLAAPNGLHIVVCTAAAFALLGYHPYAEDGGIYAAAAELRLDPSLFPAHRGFAIAHTGRSLFIPALAALARALHLPLPSTLLLMYIASLAATLAAAWWLADSLFATRFARKWSVATLAVAMGLPIAGTSLYLADPYVTARAVSTPLLLLATGLLLRRRDLAAAICLAVAAAFHPLMAMWAALLAPLLLARRSSRPGLYTVLVGLGTIAAMALLAAVALPESAAVRAAALSRDYWFLSRWQPYELLGLVAPPLMLAAIAMRFPRTGDLRPAGRDLAVASAAAATIVAIGSVLLVHPSNSSFLLARIQPMRLLHTVYLMFVLLLGGVIASVPLRAGRILRWSALVAGACGLVFMQRSIYSSSDHMEMPWRTPSNGYEQAFLWARANTPRDALFATDANYTIAHGENADVFRAVSLRSSLPDAAKDGGISSVMPTLAPTWLADSEAQRGLNVASDRDRLSRLKPLGATWIVLPAEAPTHFQCGYTNRVAKVCTLP